jgi:hypothetical protein
MAVIEWTPQEDAIILKHVRDPKYKKATDAFLAASLEIGHTLAISRSADACSQHYNKAKLGKKGHSTEIMIVKAGQKVPVTIAYDVAVMAIQRLQPHERLRLVERMLNNEL